MLPDQIDIGGRAHLVHGMPPDLRMQDHQKKTGPAGIFPRARSENTQPTIRL
jgi:hypothetical protein